MSIAHRTRRGPLARLTASTALAAIAATAVATAGSGTTGCSADLRDFYQCDALVHALCKKYSSCQSGLDESKCYDDLLARYTSPPPGASAFTSSSDYDRNKCIDHLDVSDTSACFDAIDGASCDGGPRPVSACGKLVFDPKAPPTSSTPAGTSSSSGGSSGTSSSGSSGQASSSSGTVGNVLATESTGVIALAVDSSNLFWINGSKQLKGLTSSGPFATSTGASGTLLALSSDYLYLGSRGASSPIYRVPLSSLGSGGTPQADQVGTATNLTGFAVAQSTVIYTSPNGVFELQPATQPIQSSSVGRTAPSFDSNGYAYWGTLGSPSTIWQWQGGAPSPVGSVASLTGVYGKFYTDSNNRLYTTQNGQIANLSGTVSPLTAGTDGDSFIYAAGTTIQKVSSTGTASIVTTASSSISILAVGSGSGIAYADTNGNIYRAQ